MTVETTARSMNFSGGQTNLTFTFRALYDHPDDIKVWAISTGTGAITALTYSTQYTVTISTTGIGGTVRVSPSVSTSNIYKVYRDTDLEQESDYDDYNQFPADTLEEDLDRLMLISQEQDDDIANSTDKIAAWVSFDGTASSPISPEAFHNTASTVVKNSTGDYTITFSPTLSSTAYSVILTGGGTTNFLSAKIKDGTTKSTSAITIQTINTSFAVVDTRYVSVTILKKP